LKFQLLEPWKTFNFGPERGCPKIKFHYERPQDQEKLSRIYGTLVKDIGLTGIGLNHLHDRFGIPKPKPTEETLNDGAVFVNLHPYVPKTA